MEKIDVIYLYEHVARELDVACAVKCIVEQRYGIRIELVHWPSGLPRAFSRFRPRVVALTHCYSAGDYQSTLLEWRNSVFFNLAWEQLLCPATRNQKMPSDEFARKHVIHQAWSDFFANDLLDQGIPGQNIFINGHPAYMLYEEPYRQYFMQRLDLASQYHLDENRKWIFFPENFAWAFLSDKQVQTDWLQRGTSRDEANTMIRFARASLEEIMKWCVEMASDSSVELIIRPRPATPLDDFRVAAQQIIGVIPERMHFIKEESIREWIMASDVVISSYSTSLIEAALAGKSAYLLEPYPIPKFLHSDWHDYITHLKTPGECTEACLNGFMISDNDQLASWARTTMQPRGDAIWNLAEFLAKICRGEIQPPSLPNRKTVTKTGRFRLPKWALYEYRRIRHQKLRRNAAVRILPVHENDHLSPIEIEQRTDKWKHLLACSDNRKSK